jgi:hypothetical protein
MIDEQPRPLPESVGALVLIAVRAYQRRFGLYFGVAFAGLAAEAVAAYVRRNDGGFVLAGSIVVDSLVAALVTIGVIADMRQGERARNASVVSAAIAKWGIVAVVTMLVVFITSVTAGTLIDEPSDAITYAFMILPVAVFWGSIGFATVIAAIDEKTSPFVLAFSSIGRSMTLAFARQNFGRLVALALVAMLPTLVEMILSDQLGLRKVAASDFISVVPIDALLTGPLQAGFTIFYLDFVRRCAAGR